MKKTEVIEFTFPERQFCDKVLGNQTRNERKMSLTWQCGEYNRLAYAGGLSQSGQGGTPSASEFSMANFQNRLALGPKRSSRNALVVREIVSRSPSCMYEIIYLIAVR